MRLTVLGGGGFRVPLVHRALLSDHTPERVTQLRLHDTDPNRLQVMRRVLEDQAAGHPDPPAISTTADLGAAVDGADFIFSAIRVGGLAGRLVDEQVALNNGVVGQETVGVGGIVYALRTIPIALEMARTIARRAPGAWTINFTNPAGVITEAMRTVLGERVIGICDSPVGLARHALSALGATPDTAEIDYVGLNHLGWLRGLHVDGRDRLPDLLADDVALASFEEGRLFGAELIRDLGALPNEYLYYYYNTREAIAADLRADTTRAQFLADQQHRFYADCAAHPHPFTLWDQTRLEREETYMATARDAAGGMDRDDGDLESGGYDRVALAIMRAMTRDEEATLILNVANDRLLPGLDGDAVIEVPCRVSADGIAPLPTSPLPDHAQGLVTQIKYVERCEIDAATEASAASALRAIAAHPLVDSVNVARTLLRHYREQLPGLAYLR